MNDITQTGPNAVGAAMSEDELRAYYQQAAEHYAATERAASSTIRANNGTLSVGDQPIPGNQFAAVILDAARLNTYYASSYNPNQNEPPTCYAIGRTDDELAPHPDMSKDVNHFRRQADTCNACPMNEFGSRGQGEGKACSNRRRLIMLLAGTYNQTPNGLQLSPYTTPEHYRETPFLSMTLAPTSLKGWGEYVRTSAAQYQRPFFGIVTRVYLYSHPKHGKEAIGFEPMAEVPQDWAHEIIPRQQQAMKDIMQSFEPPQQKQHPQGGFHQQAQQGQ